MPHSNDSVRTGGMRGIKAMHWKPSVYDANEGTRFWRRIIPECQAVLPTAEDGTEMVLRFNRRGTRV